MVENHKEFTSKLYQKKQKSSKFSDFEKLEEANMITK